jgi:uncharacterized membrane protein HdeD (DUF308 family)
MTHPSTEPAGDDGTASAGAGGIASTGGKATSTGGKASSMGGKASSTDGASSAGTRTATGATPTAAPARVPQARQHPENSNWSEPSGETVAVYRGDNLLAAAAKASWAAVLLGGLCMIAAGILLLAWPRATLTVVAVLIGLALVVSGLVKLYEGFTARAESAAMRTAYVVIGLLAVLAGLYCLRHHALSILLVAFVTGVYFIMHGIADIGVAVSDRGVPGRGLRAALGVFSVAAGIIMVVWPALTLVLLLTIAGAWLLFYGLSLIFMAFSLRRAAKQLTRPTPAPRLAAST